MRCRVPWPSGECVFDMEAIGKAARIAGAPLESSENGKFAGLVFLRTESSGSTSLAWNFFGPGARGKARGSPGKIWGGGNFKTAFVRR